MSVRSCDANRVLLPRLGLGSGPLGDPALGDAEAARLVDAALDLGVTLFDAAPSYGAAEERLGRALAGRRARAVLCTKLGYGVPGIPDWTPDCIAAGVDRALARLRTDRVDLLVLHSCPLEVLERPGLVEALTAARDAGKVRAVGYSGDGAPLEAALSDPRLDAFECSVNVLDQEALARLAAPRPQRPLVLAKRPLANAPWREPAPPDAPDRRIYWERFRELDVDPGAVAWDELFLRFAAFAPGVDAALVGTSRVAGLERAAQCVARGPLPDELQEALRGWFGAHGARWHGVV